MTNRSDDMKRGLAIFCAVAVLTAALGFMFGVCISEPEEPKFCALCHPAPYHAPCLINITTGDITELDIYEPHAIKVGEVSQTQSGGYMRLSMAGGVFVRSSPDTQKANTSIPIEKARLNRAEFCFDCRDLLSSAKTKYVLADLYDPDNIIIYDIVDGICCTMRDYEVTAVFSNDGKEAAITNTGHMLDP